MSTPHLMSIMSGKSEADCATAIDRDKRRRRLEDAIYEVLRGNLCISPDQAAQTAQDLVEQYGAK